MHRLPELACCLSLSWCLQAPAQTAAPAPVRRALLIGINAYASSDVPKLRGCVNDVEAMRLVLTGRYGFAPGDVRLITDAAATRKGILAALEQLVEQGRAGDTIFIHYAGHGSQVADQDGDEADGKDETLVPYDGRTEGVPDITDDELNAIFARLRTDAAVIVLDCCHSGTGTRSVAVRARQIDEDKRTELYRGKPVGTRAIVPLASERYVLMTGAADRESALDGPIEGSYHGAFSYALTRVLASAPADTAPRLLFKSVESEMRRLGDQWMISSMPEPQLEAPAKRLDAALMPPPMPAGGGAQAAIPRLAWSEVELDPATQRASLDAHALGAVSGSRWAIYPADETSFAPGGSYAVGEVAALDGGRAYLELDPRGTAIAKGSRAILSTPPPASEEIPVHLRGASAEQTESLARALRAALPGFKSVGDGEFARLYVEVDGSTCRVLGSDGVALVATVPLAAGEDLSGKLSAVVERCLDTAALLALDNPSSRLQLELRVGAPSTRQATKIGDRGFKVVADTGAPVFHFGQQGRSAENSLQVSVRASLDCYLTIVDVDAEGAMKVLFPNDYSKPDFLPRGRIAGGEWHQIPDSLADPNRAGFWWDAAPPAGLDTIRVFASTDPGFAEELRAALESPDKEAAPSAERGVIRAGHAKRRAGLGVLRRSLASRGFKVVGGEPESKPPVPSAPASPTVTNPPTQAEEPAFDWKAASATARIEK